jgi:hypothetical protein
LGVDKFHVACTLGHAWIEAGHAVLFTPTYALELPRMFRKFDRFDTSL